MAGTEVKPSAQKLSPVNNFYARVSDGYVVCACHKRPAPGVAQAHSDQVVTRREGEAKANALRAEETRRAQERRAEEQKRTEMVTRPQAAMQTGRFGSAKRIMLGVTMIGMLGGGAELRRS